ncbi:uncharacterized protein LOC131237352 isoform X2 [Magnolia sinica]|uniref:uncharacterized protein LOC131237352 isoform X2 n=1 Tax=Magnolia sinica TaxID=86752 RepID=UPI002658977F|nr:uncharacterized protein LOC131237352 isoform X2 [Magnolia sinica]
MITTISSSLPRHATPSESASSSTSSPRRGPVPVPSSSPRSSSSSSMLRGGFELFAGLSLKSQELTAMFLAVRLYCSFVMEFDIHTLLDSAALMTTLWVIYMIRFKLKSSYMEDKDNFAIYFVAAPCAILALVVHPSTSHNILNRILWAFCVYLEAVSVLPQLRVMQNTKIVEPFTAHYVFALGVARFLSCAHWVLQVLDTRGQLLTALGYGLWPSMVLLSEIVQTFILADFCYYYIKSVVGGQLVLRIPSGVV